MSFRPQITILSGEYPGVVLFRYKYWETISWNGQEYPDPRGGSCEIYSEYDLSLYHASFKVAQTSRTDRRKGSLVGLHFQLPPTGIPDEERQKFLQGKLITVNYGRIWDVVVDLRTGTPENPNPHFGHTQAFLLCDNPSQELQDDKGAINHGILYVPPGFGHGFLSVPDDDHTMKGHDGPMCQLIYMLDNAFDVGSQQGIVWNDPVLHIDWGLKEFGLREEDLIISEKDRRNMTIAEARERNMLPI